MAEFHGPLGRWCRRTLRVAALGPAGWLGAAALALAVGTAACADYDPRSTLQVYLSATPHAEVDGLQLRVTQVEVHVVAEAKLSAAASDTSIDDDAAWHTLAVDQTVELGEVAKVGGAATGRDLGTLRLPEGWIDQLRVSVASPMQALSGAKRCALLVSKLPKAGIKVSQAFRPFAVHHQLTHAIWLNLRLDKGLTKSGDCWSLGPQLEVLRFTTGGKDVSVQ